MSVKSACAILMSKVSGKIDCSDALTKLANDFNWKVRQTVAESIFEIQCSNKLSLLDDLIQDEERDVI